MIGPLSPFFIMWKITKSFEWDMAHRLLNYDGLCGNVHGHRYTAIIQYAANELDHQGFVIDFSEVSKYIRSTVDKLWDHGIMLNTEDPLVEFIKPHTNKIYLLDRINPTAENIAKELYIISKTSINHKGKNFWLESVTVKETPTSEAHYKCPTL